MRHIQLQLTQKVDHRINSYDLSKYNSGDVIEVPGYIALMLLAEGWATPVNSPISGQRSPRASAPSDTQ
jgi:hypothetical protein